MKSSIKQKDVKRIIDNLFKDGKTPLEHAGIDGERIIGVEERHPEVAKQYPRH